MPSFLSSAAAKPATKFVVVREGTGNVLVTDLMLALDSATRRKGLLGRDGLPPQSGLIIAPSNAVHTFFMRFPIDVVFLARTGEVLKICAAVGPRRVAACLRGFAVLEMPAGQAREAGLARGERLRLEPASET